MKIGILGLGLIGGSLARDLSARGITVVGYDRSAATMRAVKRARIVSGAIGSDFEGVESCDVCVIAVPVDVAPALLERVASRLADVPCITDVGSTKASIVRAATRLGLGRRFVGGHPFAGDHLSGWRSSREGIFRGARVFLCPTAHTHRDSVAAARRLWRLVGARPTMMDAKAHDAFVARASHLPQIASTALAITLAQSHVARGQLGPGGRDVTRLAGADPDVWSAIALDNSAALVPLLARYERAIRDTRNAIESGRAGLVRARLNSARWWSVRDEHAHADTRPQSPRHWTRVSTGR